MYQVGVVEVVGFLILAWLSTLTFFFLRERGYLRELFPKSEARDIRSKLREAVEAITKFEQRTNDFEEQLKRFQKEGLYHIQKVAVLRYNPYNDTGGDQSFSLVMLDGSLNGLLLTSLHSRSGTRIYIKNIRVGKSDLELSREEGQVLKKVLET